MDRRPGSGRPRTTTSEENEKMIEDLICSQEPNPANRMSPREKEKNIGISSSSATKLIKRKGLK